MELSSQFAGLNVGSGSGSSNGLSAGSRLKSKRSQRFTVPVHNQQQQPQLPNPAASPPFSNSTSEESGPTAGSSFSLSNTASSDHHHHHHFNNNNAPSTSSYPSLFPPPPSNFAQTQQTTPTNTTSNLVNGGSSNALSSNAGQFEHAFLQQDPFAYPSSSSAAATQRTRTLSSGSSSSNSQHQHQYNNNNTNSHHQSTGSLSANGIWADQPQLQQQQRQNGPFDSFTPSNLIAASNPRNGSPFNQGPFQQQQQQQQQQTQPTLRQQFNSNNNGQSNAAGSNAQSSAPGSSSNGPDDIIPTAIVIKNIPFNFPSTSLLQIIEELTLAPPYAFNYHYDMSVFRGLAFANFHTPQETDACVAALNGFEIQGRKLRVEYKKVLQAGEKERIERDKAIKRMRSMQLDRERIIQQQQAHVHHLQQQIFGQQQQQPPLPPHLQHQQQQQHHFQHQGQQMHPMNMNQQQYHHHHHQMNAPSHGHHQHQQSNDDFEDYGRAVHPSNSMFNQPNGQMGINMNGMNAFSPPMEMGDSYPSQTSGGGGGSGASSSSRTGSGSSMPTELDMNDSQTLELYSRVLLFKEDALRDELAFSKALSSVQRRIVHLIAQKLNLDHRSAGSGDERYVVVSKPGSNSSVNGANQQPQAQQQRSLRTRASAYPMLNPDPYAPPQPSLLPDGMNMQGFTNAMRKKSMPDLRHQPQHPLYSNPDYQQYPSSAQGGSSFHQQQHQHANNATQANVTPRHSTHDLRAVAASASNRRSMYFHTSAPGEDNSIPPVPALPANLFQQNNNNNNNNSSSSITGLPSNAVGGSTPNSAPPNGNSSSSHGSGSDRHSIIFGSGSVDLDNTSIIPPKSANNILQASTLSLDSKIVGSPVKSDPSSAAAVSANGVVRQPRGPDNASSWTRAAGIAVPGAH
ncbi:hypothetical protein P389DRAFT_196449 [Cystobasidium minutum MCA 4210]|uniref:uncharacterized protein n=1 Tax=Cystobasidium minutum MCA 4210 TaxID=1397322 RepID=UPI0034CE225A|eukprot:jgi/Rhomi1/196449/gm1.4663_g